MRENLSKWQFYLKDIVSPDSYIEMSFYSMISAALQRRVYLGSEERPLFPNMFVILVGKPSVGKGLVIRPVIDIVSHYSIFSPELTTSNAFSQVEAAHYAQIKARLKADKKDNEKNTFHLLPCAADTASFEALVQEHNRAIRVFYPRNDEQANHPYFKKTRANTRIYKHNSLNVFLEEAATLFRRNQDDIVNYFLKTFDCGTYRKITKTQGIEFIPNTFVNLLAGTTPDFIRETFDDRLLNEGFASRSICVFEEANRFNRFDFSDVNKEQLQAKTDLIQYVLQLTQLFGKVAYSPDAYEFSRYYVEEVLPYKRVNSSTRLDGYYGRKALHLKKLSMAVHFGNSTDMIITLEDCEIALKILDNLERKMDLALETKGKNAAGSNVQKIIKYIQTRGACSFTKIWGEFIHELNRDQLTETLEFLLADGRLVKHTNGKVDKYGIATARRDEE